MINWNKELVETILNKILEKNSDTMSCIVDIGTATTDSIVRRIDDAEYAVDQADTFIYQLIGCVSEEDYDKLMEYLE